MAKADATKIKITRNKACPAPDKETVALLIKFLKYSIKELGLQGKEIKIRLLGKNPSEPITTGAYDPSSKTISTIMDGRHLVDWCRTIAHELTHQKQDYDGKLKTSHPEIGGEIEDDANIMSGRIVKYFIKNILTAEDKKRLGLGTYGEKKIEQPTSEPKDAINEQIRLLLELYGGELILKTDQGDKRVIVSKNTRVGEKPYRMTFPFPQMESGWSHIALDRVDADLLLNHIVPDHIRNELPFYINAIADPVPTPEEIPINVPVPASDASFASLGQLVGVFE